MSHPPTRRTHAPRPKQRFRYLLCFNPSVVTHVEYAPGRIAYETFDDAGEDLLRLSFVPMSVAADGRALARAAEGAGWTFDSASGVLRVRRGGERAVTVSGTATPASRLVPRSR